jgi:hypothetical protein
MGVRNVFLELPQQHIDKHHFVLKYIKSVKLNYQVHTCCIPYTDWNTTVPNSVYKPLLGTGFRGLSLLVTLWYLDK